MSSSSASAERKTLDRASVAAALHEIAELLKLQGANKFKARAFERGARALEASKVPIDRLVDERLLLSLPGVGVAIARQIEELHRSGRSELLTSLREGLPSGVLELAQVPGIGLHALKRLREELGVQTVEDLKQVARDGRLVTATGFGERRASKILDAIERYEKAVPKVLLADGLRLASSLSDEMRALPGVCSVHLAGELRRYTELSEGISLVVAANDTDHVAQEVASIPRAASVQRESPDRVRMRLADGTRTLVRVASPDQIPTMLVHATAAAGHWEKLVLRAAARGLRLEPTGLSSSDGAPISLRDDADLYAHLGMSVVPPEMREDAGEFEQAIRGKRFELVAASDLRGFVHCHTTWSDGAASIEDLALAAEARGAEFVTVTDHSAAAHYAGGLDVDRLHRQWDEIAAVQEKVRVRILRGSEVDILADGALDLPDTVLEELDVVIASIHNRFRQDEDRMTERVTRALRHPVFKIWGHPLGRLVGLRPPIPLRVEDALDALAESRGAIEISGDPRRLDLEPKWIRAARERGIPFVLSVDAHSVGALDNVVYAAGLARRAGVSPPEVLNVRSAADFLQATRFRSG